MPYATVADVAARAAFRGTYTVNTVPNASQVIGFIQESAAQLDQWLFAGGYAAPFDAAIASGLVATSGQLLLRRWNVTGAALLVEQSAEQPVRAELYQKLWDEIKAAIQSKENDIFLPENTAKLYPRGPGAPGGPAAPAVGITADINARVNSSGIGSWDL